VLPNEAVVLPESDHEPVNDGEDDCSHRSPDEAQVTGFLPGVVDGRQWAAALLFER